MLKSEEKSLIKPCLVLTIDYQRNHSWWVPQSMRCILSMSVCISIYVALGQKGVLINKSGHLEINWPWVYSSKSWGDVFRCLCFCGNFWPHFIYLSSEEIVACLQDVIWQKHVVCHVRGLPWGTPCHSFSSLIQNCTSWAKHNMTAF